MTARDEGAGTMGRGEEVREMLSWLDMSIERLRGRQDLTEANLRNKYLRLRALLASPVSAPGLSLAARLMSIASDDDVRLAVAGELSDREIPCYPKYLDDVFGTYLDHPAMRKALSTGQEITSPADGSQVEPSTTGAGRHIPLEPNPFIQWNGGENPAPGKMVDVRLRSGGWRSGRTSHHLDWGHRNSAYDIISYRIIPTDDQGGEG